MSKKGSQFERDIARTLSEWWSNKGDDDLFYRTQSSGARATVRSKKGKTTKGQYGDICSVDGRGKTLLKACTISLKRGYQKHSIQDIMDIAENAKTNDFRDWIKECISHHRAAGSIGWLLILRKNRRKALVFMPLNFVFNLDFNVSKRLLQATPNVIFIMNTKIKKKKIKRMTPQKYMTWVVKNNCVVFGVQLDQFLSIVDRKHIVEMVRKYHG